MLRTLTVSALLALASCPAEPVTDAPTAKPRCEADVTLLASFDHPTLCDVSPPQTIAVRLDDPGDAQLAECDDAGGQVLNDPEAHTTYCINIDY